MSWYFGICAVALFVGATFLLVARARLSLFGARTTGEVVAYTSGCARPRGAGERHAARALRRRRHARAHLRLAHGREPARWPVGTSVPVAFLEGDPSRAEIATFAPALDRAGGAVPVRRRLAFAAYTAA